MPEIKLLYTLGLTLTLLLSSQVFADEVATSVPGGLKALASYQKGDADTPAVLVLHGFLQTQHFSTVRLIDSELHDAGFSVLSPTLTLNIDQRHTSLTCDAIQNHSVEQANGEIKAWVDWLKQQGHRRIILIGHSTGSDHLLSYLHEGADPAIIALIATSAGPLENWKHPEESHKQMTEARSAAAHGDKGLKRFSLGFCHNNYMAPANDFLSYRQWTTQWVLQQLKNPVVPTTVVLGEKDKWLPPDWPATLERNHIPLVLISDANHYFSGMAEFDFQVTVRELAEAAAKPRGQL